jgi:glutamate N-acetyltransferase / amino-acid N-acetyltransferase
VRSTIEFTIAPATGGVTAAGGFTSAALHVGIKASSSKLDLAVIAADRAVPAAALFTTNLAQAAPVLVSREHIEQTRGRARAVVVNSGCANACTGTDGMANARRMAADVADSLGCSPQEVLVASTGVIGVALPIDKVSAGISRAAADLARG